MKRLYHSHIRFFLAISLIALVSCSQSDDDSSNGDNNEDSVIAQTADDQEPVSGEDTTDNTEDTPASASILHRDNARDVLALVLQIYSGQAYDSRYAWWSTGQTMLGDSSVDVEIDGMSFNRYACENGGTLDHRSLNTGSRGGLAHGFFYTDCLIEGVLISGRGDYFAGSDVDNFTPDLVMDFGDGSSLELRGLFQRHTANPAHESYDYWRGAANTYRYTSSDGAEESIESSTSYERSVDCCEGVLLRELSGDVTVMHPITNNSPIIATINDLLVSSSDNGTTGFDQGQLTLSAGDGSSIVLLADRNEFGELFELELNNDAGTEAWLESWADWEPLLSIPSL